MKKEVECEGKMKDESKKRERREKQIIWIYTRRNRKWTALLEER